MSNNLQINDKFGSMPTEWGTAIKIAEMFSKSTLVPKELRGKPGDILLTLQMGAELGLSPTQALQNISIINGRATLWGDSMLGLVKRQSDFVDCIETLEKENGILTATCIVKRKNQTATTQKFSWEDAKTARLTNKQGPWQTHPKQMLKYKARGFALRDAFPDVLKGIITREEANDYGFNVKNAEINITPPESSEVNFIESSASETKSALPERVFDSMLEKLSNNEIEYFDSKIEGAREKYLFSEAQDEKLQTYYNLALDRNIEKENEDKQKESK